MVWLIACMFLYNTIFMTRIAGSRISLKQAMSLGLLILAVYFPIILYVNIPIYNIWGQLDFLLLPAGVNLAFYVIFILAADRIIDRIEGLVGEKFLVESQLPAVILSIPIALLATIFLQFMFDIAIMIFYDIRTYTVGSSAVSPNIDLNSLEMIKRVNNGLSFLIILSISYLLINRKATVKMKSLELEAQKLINENTLAQYEALKNQVSPHFLFNSLSILSSLVHVSPDLSEKFIDRLSKAYRYILEQKDNAMVRLSTELGFISSYAFLLGIRFDNKFVLKESIQEGDAEKYFVAPLSLQLLVENAVKHNRMSAKEPLIVSIYREEAYLVVENPMRPRNKNEAVKSTGIGLNNIINRYKLLSTEPVMVEQSNEVFKVKIPLIV